MKIICHRGNTFGPDPDNENKPEVIDYCIRKGYDVEIDLWYYNNKLYLGHDEPTYQVDADYLMLNKDRLWIHCKNLKASAELNKLDRILFTSFNYFFNDSDNYSLTSLNYIWTYPRSQKEFTYNQVLLDFRPNVNFKKYSELNIHGVCVDYVD